MRQRGTAGASVVRWSLGRSTWAWISLALLLTVSQTVLATQRLPADAPTLITSDPSQLVDIPFDHIVIGAGLAGMVMATRLSEDRDKTVLLIEAGNDTRADPLVRTVRLDNAALQIQWKSRTQIGDHPTVHSLGIGLGGSTSINGAKVDGPPSSQIDAFQDFGNVDWSWAETLRYMKKSQNYQAPGEVAAAHGATYDPHGHGLNGPMDITFSPQSYTGYPQHRFIEALNDTMQIDKIVDAGAGEAIGYSYCPHFIKHGTNITRESSATAYLSPIEYERSNLVILTGWRGIRIEWDDEVKQKAQPAVKPAKSSPWPTWQRPFTAGSWRSTNDDESDESLRAKGVTVQARPDGPTYTFHIDQANPDAQVIVSAGALITPLLLELSGVGDPAILSQLDVKTRINLPGVGRNLADKPTNIVAASSRGLHREGVTGDPLPAVAMLSIDKIFPDNVTAVERSLRANRQKWARQVVRSGGAVNVEGALRQYDVMLRGIFRQQWPVAEWEYFSRNLIAIKSFVLQPFSRGFVHSLSRNSVWNLDGADVDLHGQMWSQTIDMDMQVASMQAARTLMNSPKMRNLWHEETGPGMDGFQALPAAEGDAQEETSEGPHVKPPLEHDAGRRQDYSRWRDYILRSYDLICHNSGTAAMTLRRWGGVVDQRFKVYGTQNVRVVDASIFPLQLSAHPSLTIFGVAERAADIVRQGLALPATSTTN